MKVCVVVGTRPEGIKLAPVILALRAHPAFVCRVCITGQHRQMLDQVVQLFGIRPDADLDVMQANQSLAGLSSRALERLDSYFAAEVPDLIVAQGDTTTTFCAALAAFYRRIPLAHVEAGLRTGNLMSPWPEEANRVLTTRLAGIHFAPTNEARDNLLREGVSTQAIHVTGNTVIDALLIALSKVRDQPPIVEGIPDFLQPGKNWREGMPRMVLITGHRRENFGAAFENICLAISDLAAQFSDVHFVYPVHLNPNVREPVERILGSVGSSNLLTSNSGALSRPSAESAMSPRTSNIHLLGPLSYLPFVGLMDRSTLILTDSGGVQEEAPSLGKPVLVMRDTTERPEAVSAGTVKLVGTDRLRIVEGVRRLLTDQAFYESMARSHNPYGDGHAAGRIVAGCYDFLSLRSGQHLEAKATIVPSR